MDDQRRGSSIVLCGLDLPPFTCCFLWSYQLPAQRQSGKCSSEFWFLLRSVSFTFLVRCSNLFLFRKVIARAAALVLHVDVIFILLPVCRNFISLLRRTTLRDIIPFDKSVTFHKAAAWSIVTWTVVHVVAHMFNFGKLAMANPQAQTTGQRVATFFSLNFTTGPGITGWIMVLFLAIIVWFAMEKRRRAHFERFWYSHHLFIPFFVCWQLHGMFCMIKPDRPPYCSWNTIGVFWVRFHRLQYLKKIKFNGSFCCQRYWLVGGVIWISERILREVRSRHITYISKVIQHPSNVLELQIKKEKTTIRAGQYIFLSCPEISYFQWHPFTLTRCRLTIWWTCPS